MLRSLHFRVLVQILSAAPGLVWSVIRSGQPAVSLARYGILQRLTVRVLLARSRWLLR